MVEILIVTARNNLVSFDTGLYRVGGPRTNSRVDRYELDDLKLQTLVKIDNLVVKV